MSNRKEKAMHAKLIVRDVDTMTKEERKGLVNWLRSQAYSFERENPLDYSARFVARLFKYNF